MQTPIPHFDPILIHQSTLPTGFSISISGTSMLCLGYYKPGITSYSSPSLTSFYSVHQKTIFSSKFQTFPQSNHFVSPLLSLYSSPPSFPWISATASQWLLQFLPCSLTTSYFLLKYIIDTVKCTDLVYRGQWISKYIYAYIITIQINIYNICHLGGFLLPLLLLKAATIWISASID